MIIGIDLGTTNSAAAYFTEEGPQLIPNSIGEFLTKSVVAVDNSGEFLIGATAKEFQVLHPSRCASCFKRQMGTTWSTKLGDHTFSAVELSSLILRSIKRDAEDFFDRDIDRCVITVPAYFRDDQRKATIEAGRLAGLVVERIINEPTAAAMAYGIHEKDTEKTVVVFDLGGGTFDISVVDFFEGAIEVRASAGEAILGGEDFTRSLARHVLEQRSLNFETAELRHPLMVSRLIQQCERAKIALSKNATTTIRIPSETGELDVESVPLELTRAALEESAKHLLARIETPVRRAMNDANLKWDDVDELILVGGATRMDVIHELTSQRINRQPLCERNPDHVVALGAAVQAALIDQDAAVDDVVVVDVAPFTLGVEIAKEIGDQYRTGYSLPIINRNDVIPTSRSHTVSTISNNQTEVCVRVYQGESRRVSNNHFLGELTVHDIPTGPAGQPIEIRFTYDSNGVLEVETTVQKTGQRTSLVISKHAKNLSPEQIAATVATFEKLKIHPREKDRNRHLLLRAERVFEELPAVLRSQLTNLIDFFESAMDRQDAPSVEAAAQELNLFLSNFAPEEGMNE